MSLKVNNTKPSGTNAIPCDAGTPVMGRTSPTGVYEIIKVNAAGEIVTSALNTFLPGTAAYIGTNPAQLTLVPGAPAANTFIGFAPVNALITIDEGIYSVNPAFIFDNGGVNAGGCSFMLYKDGSTVDAYITTLPPFNAFAPGIANLLTGVFGYWHNSANQLMGGNVSQSYNRTNTQHLYLESGIYKIAVITDGAMNIGASPGLLGFYEFTKI